jgi:hypothetical protein
MYHRHVSSKPTRGMMKYNTRLPTMTGARQLKARRVPLLPLLGASLSLIRAYPFRSFAFSAPALLSDAGDFRGRTIYNVAELLRNRTPWFCENPRRSGADRRQTSRTGEFKIRARTDSASDKRGKCGNSTCGVCVGRNHDVA